MADQTVDLETRLRLAHQSRRAREHQLDDIRRALCDAGFMQDDDPYGHADLADVIRQVGEAGAGRPAGICRAVSDRIGLTRDHVYGCVRDDGHKGSWHEDRGGAKWRQIVQPPPAEPLTARGEARCQSQHRADDEPLVQCALKVHPGRDAHTDYDAYRMTIKPPHGRPADLPWIVWRDQAEEDGRG